MNDVELIELALRRAGSDTTKEEHTMLCNLIADEIAALIKSRKVWSEKNGSDDRD